MLGHIFYHSLIRKYVSLFGTLFNDIKLVKQAEGDNLAHTIHVPISYGPRESVLARLEQDPNLNKQPSIQLPRMTFELMDFQYDVSRKLGSINRNFEQAADGSMQSQYNPVPYNLTFSLYIYAKNVDDCWRIVEQILPFFTPDFTMKATLIPEMNENRDITLILDRTQLSDIYEGNFETRRAITTEISFTMKAWLYGPITSASLINNITANIFNAVGYEDASDAVRNIDQPTETITVIPGQLANGSPTTNAALTIDKSLILPNSEYGYITTLTSNTIPLT